MREVSAYLLTIQPSAKSSGAREECRSGLERKRPRLQFGPLQTSQQPGRLRSSHGPAFFERRWQTTRAATTSNSAVQILATQRPSPSYGDFVRGL